MIKLQVGTDKYPNVFCLLDDDCDKSILKYKWGIDSRGYARRNDHGKIVFLHRQILGTDGGIVDHINRDKLDNRRSNLRIVDKSTNLFNSGLFKHNKSGYRGISWSISAQKWLSRIQINRRVVHLGLYKNIEEAVSARKQYEEQNRIG